MPLAKREIEDTCTDTHYSSQITYRSTCVGDTPTDGHYVAARSGHNTRSGATLSVFIERTTERVHEMRAVCETL